MADIITVQVRLDARAATRQLNNFQRQISGVGSASEQVEKTNKSIKRSLNLLRLYATAWIGVGAALTALREIGTVQNLERAIGTVTGSSQELNATWERLQQLSLATRSDFESNVVLFQRLKFSTEALGASTEEVERVVVALASGLRLGGATGQEAASSIRQLSQAFSKGKLDGDEFRSVMENAGFLMVRFADQIGVTVGELIEMSRSGELTSQVMLKGFAAVADEMENELAAAPKTVDDAINDLRTTWLDFIRTLEISGTAVALIDALSFSFRTLGSWIRSAREELVRLGAIDAEGLRTTEEVSSRIGVLLDKRVKAEKLVDDLIAGRRTRQTVALLPGGEPSVEVQVNALLKAAAAVEEIDAELEKLGQRGLELQSVNRELAKIAEEEEKARKALRKDAELQAELRKQREADKQAAKEKAAFEKAVAEIATRTVEEQVATARTLQAQREEEEAEREAFLKGVEEFADKQISEQIAFGKSFEQQKNALQRYAEGVMKVEDVFVNAFKGMEDALVQFVTTGKLDFSSLVDSIIADVARLVIQQEITKPLANILGGAIQPTGTTTPGANAAGGSFIGRAFDFIKGFLPGFQDGTSFAVGGRSGTDRNLVAFRATKGEQVTVTPKGQAGGINIVMNIKTNDAESFGRNQDQIMNMLQSRLAIAQRNQ